MYKDCQIGQKLEIEVNFSQIIMKCYTINNRVRAHVGKLNFIVLDL